jgi:hypothetical protein
MAMKFTMVCYVMVTVWLFSGRPLSYTRRSRLCRLVLWVAWSATTTQVVLPYVGAVVA